MAKDNLDFKVRFGVDKKEFDAAMIATQRKIQNLTKAQGVLAAAQATGRVSAEKYTAGMDKLNKRQQIYISTLNNASKITGGYGKAMSANAIPATQEFSRIIQDAPYGIQGVANNIQQLTAQFGYLSSKTGGAKNALKAMIGSLWGPAGILLAVSVVTAALPSLIKAFSDSKDALEDTKMSVDDLTRAYDRYLEKSKDAQTLIAEQTKMQLALAKLNGASDDELNKITAKGASLRVSEIGKEMQKREQLIQKYTKSFNKLFEKGDEKSLELAEDYGLQIDKLNRKNEEQRIEVQKLGNAIVLSDLALALKKKEDLHKKSVENIKKINEGLFRDTPRFSGMGAGTFDNRGGGAFSGMFMGISEELKVITDEFRSAIGELSDAITEGTDDLEEKTNGAGEKVLNFGTFLAAGFTNFGQSIADGLAEGTLSIQNSGALLLNAFGDMLVSLGKALVAYGFAMLALEAAFENPWAAIAAGTAAVILGSVISKKAKGAYKSITGAASSGVSGSVGGGGSSSFSGSSSSATSTGSGGGTYVFEIEGTKLVGVLSNTLNRNRALGGSLGF